MSSPTKFGSTFQITRMRSLAGFSSSKLQSKTRQKIRLKFEIEKRGWVYFQGVQEFLQGCKNREGFDYSIQPMGEWDSIAEEPIHHKVC